ncbi:MAG: ATPase [Bdellovibrio sp.]|nr:MAG: ATPase [Bdellovibrio sp.]
MTVYDHNVMDVKQKNELLLRGHLEKPGLFPQIEALADLPVQFEPDFGLEKLPKEPGLILIRGARQMGKSTWMELQLKKAILENGAGSSFYLNGDELLDSQRLYEEIKALLPLFKKGVAARLFIDEITAIPNWENAVKRLHDEGETRHILLVTTGSMAVDLRRGHERLPGRKGRLARSKYLFLPIPYAQFERLCRSHFGGETLAAYLLCGGSPLAANELIQERRIPEFVIELTRDWIFGECSLQGRSRNLLNWICQQLLVRGETPVPLAKLARESGAANNSVVQGYVDLMADLLCLTIAHPIDGSTGRPIPRKAFKYHWIHLLAATSFHPMRPRTLTDFQEFTASEQARWFEWAVAQKLWCQAARAGVDSPETQFFLSTRDHELDFRVDSRHWIEVKRGQSGPTEFSWFTKAFPKSQLKIICSTPFSAGAMTGLLLEDFLRQP